MRWGRRLIHREFQMEIIPPRKPGSIHRGTVQHLAESLAEFLERRRLRVEQPVRPVGLHPALTGRRRPWSGWLRREQRRREIEGSAASLLKRLKLGSVLGNREHVGLDLSRLTMDLQL